MKSTCIVYCSQNAYKGFRHSTSYKSFRVFHSYLQCRAPYYTKKYNGFYSINNVFEKDIVRKICFVSKRFTNKGHIVHSWDVQHWNSRLTFIFLSVGMPEIILFSLLSTVTIKFGCNLILLSHKQLQSSFKQNTGWPKKMRTHILFDKKPIF